MAMNAGVSPPARRARKDEASTDGPHLLERGKSERLWAGTADERASLPVGEGEKVSGLLCSAAEQAAG